MTKSLLLSSDWLSRLRAFQKLIVGFSGGLDSTVLLHVLATHSALKKKIQAVHINHGISKNALDWQKHCEHFCQQLGVVFNAQSILFNKTANLEEEARVARYAAFSAVLGAKDCLILGHHLNDQAETVLLQLFRGAGIDGLAAMQELNILGAGAMARPLLACSREELENYAKLHELHWIEDESNLDTHYSRNYLRQQVIPLLTNKWPGVATNLARTATHCQQAQVNLDALAKSDCPELLVPNRTLATASLKVLEASRIANVLRVWLKLNKIQPPSTATFQRLIDEVIFASEDANPLVSWDTIKVRRYQGCLYLNIDDHTPYSTEIDWPNFPAPLMADKSVLLTAAKADEGLLIPENAKLTIKFRQGGELLVLHGQTKELKKLFQQWEIPPWLREHIPLLYINNQLAAVVGYAISDLFYGKSTYGAWKVCGLYP